MPKFPGFFSSALLWQSSCPMHSSVCLCCGLRGSAASQGIWWPTCTSGQSLARACLGRLLRCQRLDPPASCLCCCYSCCWLLEQNEAGPVGAADWFLGPRSHPRQREDQTTPTGLASLGLLNFFFFFLPELCPVERREHHPTTEKSEAG